MVNVENKMVNKNQA